ncbi:MAG: CBS domain-containing protein [Candidatus Omnitrophica bacterium]|nr:CBS domain-containing protein [Candidatus Omnitrophota bacterium]
MIGRHKAKRLIAKDVMHKPVMTVTPTMIIEEVLRLFVERQITGAPVVDDNDNVIGVISQTDLIRYQRRAPSASAQSPSYYHESDGEVLVSHMELETPEGVIVRDVMTPAAFMIEDATPIDDVARCMLQQRIHRILVTRRGKLVGIITSMDLLHALLSVTKSSEVH